MNPILIVLDDDPTGTQTVYDVPVLTSWSVEGLRREFEAGGRCVFLLTNTRAMPAAGAAELNREIARNLKEAAGGRPFTVVSRSDSTLRGHFPLETDVLAEELGPFRATILIPFFEAGGRVTIDDVHYVREGGELVPVAETPFAKDTVFGFRSSHMKEYVEEKTDGRVAAAEVATLSLELLRAGDPASVAATLSGLPTGSFAVVNAEVPSDLTAFVEGLKLAEASGERFLFRTAAQFVAARLELKPKPLLEGAALGAVGRNGGLVLVGSHVPKTTEQLEHLLGTGVAAREFVVARLLDPSTRAGEVAEAVAWIDASLSAGKDAVLYTSRERVDSGDEDGDLQIAGLVSSALVQVVRSLESAPGFLIAKGGITSSDIATEALEIRRAMVAGQILPGVPVWITGDDSRTPGMPYVVFPGNVGGPAAVAAAVRKFH